MRPAITFLFIVTSLLPALAASADRTPLTRAEVADFLRTEIQVTRKQMEMKAHAAQYDDVIRAFYDWRDRHLVEQGWTVQRFKEVRERVFAANSALDTLDDLAAEKPAREEEIAGIRDNPYFTPEQKEQMIAGLQQVDAARREQAERSKADWPAVRAWREEFKQYVQWGNGNIDTPPVIDAP